MVNGSGRECEHAGFVLLRTPMLSYDDLVSARIANEQADDTTFAKIDIAAFLSRPDIREALYLASPSLFDSLAIWREQPGSDRGQKIERSLVRYLSRMATRPTPFGTLAGCTLGAVGRQTSLDLPPRKDYTRHTRFDTEYLCSLADALQRDGALRPQLRWHPNSSLYAVGDRLHLAEWRLDGQGRKYQLVAVDLSDYLAIALRRASRGATIAEIAEALVAADADVSMDDAVEFVNELIESQVLAGELEPRLTGGEPLDEMLNQLGRLPSAGRIAADLAAARDEIKGFDTLGIGVEPEAYRRLAVRLDGLPAKPDPARMVQVDLFKPASSLCLGQNVIDEIRRGIAVLHRLSRDGADRIRKFRDAFVNRYEQQSVPLTTALDEEAGIGFDLTDTPSTDASPLLAGLTFPDFESDAKVPWSRREVHLYRRLCETLSAGADELALTEDDLRAMENPRALPLPDSFAALVRLAGQSSSAINEGRFRVSIDLASGPSGAVLLGRFCHGDARLTAMLREHLRVEEAIRPDAIYAEIVHLPEGRLGNVILRPLLREYEIPYQGVSGADDEHQIPIGDLWVTVENDRVVLRSRRLGCEIVPRLSCAHNYMRRSLGLYRFLCALQSQGRAGGLIWTWGALESAPFLPRITVGRVVLCRARWLLGKRELQRLADAPQGNAASTVQTWRTARRVPRFVMLSEEDNELFVDFENAALVDMFLHQVAGRDSALLLEMFPPPDELAVSSPDGRFTNEFVIPFSRVDLRPAPAVPQSNKNADDTPGESIATSAAGRVFAPGSEWLFAKIYCGPAAADRVLREVVRPLLSELGERVDRWFFIRYNDPDWHLRLRLHGVAADLLSEAAPRLHGLLQPLIATGSVARLMLDTYQRETERYGGVFGIERCERLFHLDSCAALEIIEAAEGDAGADARWQLALAGCHRWLHNFGLDLPGKRAVTRRLVSSFSAEFHVNSEFRRQLGTRYREQRSTLESLIEDGWNEDHRLADGFAILERCSQTARPAMTELLAAAAAGNIVSGIPDLAVSILHMHVNRVLRAAHRAHELVIYFLLDRMYDALGAKMRSELPSVGDGEFLSA